MSEDLMQDEIVRRQHRCIPPGRPRLAKTWRCECGIEYQFVDTKFGRQWQPVNARMA